MKILITNHQLKARGGSELFALGIIFFSLGFALSSYGIFKPEQVPVSSKAVSNPLTSPIEELATRFESSDISITQEGLLATAAEVPPLLAEAKLVQILTPLGTAQWAELFANMKSDGAETDTVLVIRQALLRLWSQEDPTGALQAYLHQPYPSGDALEEMLATALTKRGWEFAMTALENAASNETESLKKRVIVWSMTHDPQHTAGALSDLMATSADAKSLISTWAKIDRGAAESWLRTVDESHLELAREAFCAGLADKDLSAAKEWIQLQPDAKVRENLLNQLAWHAASSDPVIEASAFLQGLPNVSERICGLLCERWTENDPAGALAWVLSLPDEHCALMP